MKIKHGYVIRTLSDETVVVPTGEEAVNFNGMISLNHSGKLLFETLQSGASKEELVNVLTKHYDTTSETVESDVENFLNVLRKHNILDET